MEKKYKNKHTEDIATLITSSGYKLNRSTIGLIPKEYIENSNDWEEIKEEVKLVVPIGAKFKVRFEYTNYFYKIESLVNTSVKITWENKYNKYANYNVEVVNNYFDNGTWIKYEEPEKYEILSFKEYLRGTQKPSGYIYPVCHNRIGPFNNNTSVEDYLKGKDNDIYKIHSIKRISDGEIFTIDDKFINQFNNNSIIISFVIIDTSVDIQYYINCDLTSIALKDIRKFKQPLFTTEDGVDIYESDLCFGVKTDFTIYQINTIADLSYKHKLTFSTKEKAEEYIIMNKPCLSINDIEKRFSTLMSYDHTMKLRKLKELVKSRI